MPYPHIDRLSYMLDYSVSLADEITRWMDSVANSLTDVANCITHARNSLNMTGKTGDAIEVNLDSLSKAILQHTDNIGILTSARRTVAEGARTAVSHANEVKNESSSIGFSHGGLTIENDTDSGQSSPASGSTSDSSTGPDPAQAAKMQALDAKAAKYLAQLSATTDAGIVKLAEIYPPDHSNSRGRGGGGHHAHSGIPESSGAPSGTVVPASVSPQHSAAVWQRGPDVMGPVGTPGASHPIGDHSPGGAGVSGPGVRLESAQPPATGHGLTGHGGHGSPLLSPDVTDAQLGERASLGFRNQTAKPSGWTSPVVSASTLAVAGALARGANLAQARASLRQAAQAAQTTAARAGTNPVPRAGAPAATATAALAGAHNIPGRMQRISRRDGVRGTCIVDFAHTPDAMELALKAVRQITPGRLIVVFGSDGDRDRGKRPMLGAIAARLADVLVVTDENPRSEDPQTIRDAVLAGVRSVRPDMRDVEEITTWRGDAVRRGVELCGPQDTVIVTGKGHEPFLEIADEFIRYNDAPVMREAVEAKWPAEEEPA